MIFQRASGVLFHPTSLPGNYGIGDFGEKAYNFIDYLAKANQKLWQILPLNYPGFGNSPYNPISAFAGNPLLISIEKLRQNGYISDEDLLNLPKFNNESVEFERVIESKTKIFKKAFENYKIKKSRKDEDNFPEFCKKNAYWLEDFALFASLRDYYKGISWNRWNEQIAFREKDAVEKWQNKLSDGIAFHKFIQYKFSQQWAELKSYANNKGIKIIGDIPIYVSFDSADFWTHRDLFLLNEKGNPSVVAGTPPDCFSETGQLWGNPIYNWKKMNEDKYEWWQKRIKHLLTMVDYIRIDHFVGFVRYWAVPAGENTAVNGRWQKGPGETFFSVIEKKLGKLPIIAEDLGVITPEVIELKEKYGFPGMKILQFSFGENDLSPHKFEQNSVAYTGTHDNDTILGWFNYLEKYERGVFERLKKYLQTDGNDICWDMIKMAFSTPANWAIIPLQDILCLDSDARMNTPGTAEGNWGWRYKREMLIDEIAEKLAGLTTKYKR